MVNILPKVPPLRNVSDIPMFLRELDGYFRDLLNKITDDGEISWDTVNKGGSSISDLDSDSHTLLSDIGSNTHAQIDTKLSDNSANIASNSSDIADNVVDINLNASNLSSHTASKTTHGVSGEIVGTSDTQNLSNKTIIDDLTHTGTKIGLFGATPVLRASAYTPTSVTTSRTFNADTVTVDALADVVGTLIADLQSYGILQ